MTDLRWAPGPGPAPDGLRAAFRRAHHRRIRTALTTSLPAVVGVAALAAFPAVGGSTSSLDVSPAHRPAASATAWGDAVPPDAPATSGRSGISAGAGATAGRLTAPGGARPAGSRGEAPPTPLPTLPPLTPSRPATGYLDLSAAHTASTHVVLAAPAHPDFERTAFTTSGTYAAVYLVADDGSVAMGAFRIPEPPGATTSDHPVRAIGARAGDPLPAGGYTAYVVGDASVRAMVPLAEGETGVAATATGPATVHLGDKTHAFGSAETEADLRLPVAGDGSSVGLAGAWLTGTGKAGSAITACLASRDAACGPDDDHSGARSEVSVGGTEGATMRIDDGTLDHPRDVLTHGSVGAATNATLYAWYLVLDL